MSTNEPDPTFAEAVSEDIAALKMTQDQIGETLGVSQQAVSRWARGYPPANDRIIRLANLRGPDSKLWSWLKEQGVEAEPATTPAAPNIAPSPADASQELRSLRRFFRPSVPAPGQLAQQNFYRAVVERLPERLRKNADQRNVPTPAGPLHNGFDYVGERLALDMVNPRAGAFLAAAENRLLALASFRQATLSTHPNRKYVLMVLDLTKALGVSIPLIQNFMTQASILGVTIIVPEGVSDAAGFIWAVEEGKTLDEALSTTAPGD